MGLTLYSVTVKSLKFVGAPFSWILCVLLSVIELKRIVSLHELAIFSLILSHKFPS